MGRQKIAYVWSLEKNSWHAHTTWHFVLPFSVVVGRSHHASLTKTKRVLKKENRSSNDASKGYLKAWVRWNSQSFQGQCHKRGLQRAIWTPSCKRPTCWCILGYGLRPYKIQSFMKNGGQEKFLDKALTLDTTLALYLAATNFLLEELGDGLSTFVCKVLNNSIFCKFYCPVVNSYLIVLWILKILVWWDVEKCHLNSPFKTNTE